jgi:hypothetical protein
MVNLWKRWRKNKEEDEEMDKRLHYLDLNLQTC